MSNRIALYRKTLRELNKELHELEDHLEYLESRKRVSLKKIHAAEDNIDDCIDDIDTVKRMLNRLLQKQKPPIKKPPIKKPSTKLKPFQTPPAQKPVVKKPLQRKPSPVTTVQRRATSDVEDEYDDYYDGDELDDREQYVEEYGDDALEMLDDLLSDFPELDEYLDDEFAEMDDEDFYEPER